MGCLEVIRGGTDEERLYLYDAKIDAGDDICIVKKTDMPDIENVIARHLARYHFVASFCRPKMKVLDFPCGSGYGSEILRELNIDYEGRDYDEVSLTYAQEFYKGFFTKDDLINPNLRERQYDVIACIEGIEHIERQHQGNAIRVFHDALKPGGVLIVTSPEPNGGKNPYHLGEMNKVEFKFLLGQFANRQILTITDKNHRGETTNFLYGVCRKDG